MNFNKRLSGMLKMFLPPGVVTLFNKYRPDYGWKGNFASWDEAKNVAIGYDAKNILDRVRDSLLKVKNGEAIFERDGVLFDEVEYSWPLLSAILLSATKNNNKNTLSVLDFGGGLGSSYYQNKKFLDLINRKIEWVIVEQENFVQTGKKYFEDNVINFYSSLNDALEGKNYDILLFASVLQYLENPYELIKKIFESKFNIVVVDRTIMHKGLEDRICIQKVPVSISKSSYPCRIFSEKKLLDAFKEAGYDRLEKFQSIGWRNNDYEFNGYIFIAKN